MASSPPLLQPGAAAAGHGAARPPLANVTNHVPHPRIEADVDLDEEAELRRLDGLAAKERRTQQQRESKQRRLQDPTYRARYAEQRRLRRLRAQRNPSAQDMLGEMHECSGAMITANSRRLRYLTGDPEAYRVAKEHTIADINRCARVPLEVKACCTRAFLEQEHVEMKVCGACGLRNPDEQYKRSRPLTGLPSDHGWS